MLWFILKQSLGASDIAATGPRTLHVHVQASKDDETSAGNYGKKFVQETFVYLLLRLIALRFGVVYHWEYDIWCDPIEAQGW